MSNVFKRWSILVVALLISFLSSTAGTNHDPLRDSEVLALVAGAALPVNIAHEIAVRGLDFTPDAAFRSQLRAAGADDAVFAALKVAKISASGAANDKAHQQLLQHLATAGKLMGAKKYDAAAIELNGAIDSGSDSPAVGFVMGEVLRATERHSEAVAVYAELLKQNRGFPEAHTKLSYNLYRTGEPDEALREAKLAIAENPGNPEAHKNLGLAFEDMRKFDAAAAEFQEALRLKPDYAIKLERRAKSIQSPAAQASPD